MAFEVCVGSLAIIAMARPLLPIPSWGSRVGWPSMTKGERCACWYEWVSLPLTGWRRDRPPRMGMRVPGGRESAWTISRLWDPIPGTTLSSFHSKCPLGDWMGWRMFSSLALDMGCGLWGVGLCICVLGSLGAFRGGFGAQRGCAVAFRILGPGGGGAL